MVRQGAVVPAFARTQLGDHPSRTCSIVVELHNDALLSTAFTSAPASASAHEHLPMPRVSLPPPLTRGLLLVLVSLSALNAVLRTNKWRYSTSLGSAATTATDYLTSPRWAIPYLVLVPTQSIRFPWTFFTSPVVENNIVSIVISAVVVFYGGRYLERALGTKEFGKFVMFVTLLPSVLSFLIYALWHALTPPPEL